MKLYFGISSTLNMKTILYDIIMNYTKNIL